MVLGLLVLAPLLALVPAALMDAGPDARVRLSIFPPALAVYDPFVWTCVGHGLVLGATVAISAVLVGVSLGRILAGHRSWTRALLEWLVVAPAVAPPAFLALGLLGLFPPDGPPGWRRLVDESAAWSGYPGQTWAWVVWGWSALAQGVGLVALATGNALAKVDPRREEAAALVGATPRRIWRGLTWPEVRPAVAEAAALVFILNFADPGAPLVLGLRRTPGFQIAWLAGRSGPFAQVAAMMLIVAGLSGCVWMLVRWWGGPAPSVVSGFREEEAAGLPFRSAGASPTRGGWRRSAASILVPLLVLAGWSILAWLPVVGLLRMGMVRESGALTGILALVERPVSTYLFHSAGLAALLAPAILFAAWAVPLPRVGVGPGDRKPRMAAVAMALPPLLWGVGLLAASRALHLANLATARGDDSWPLAPGLSALSAALDPRSFAGLPLLLGMGFAVIPRKLLAWRTSLGRDEVIARRVDQAILAGSGQARAYRMARRGLRTVPLRRVILWSALAATSVSPAIVLSATAEDTPAGPAVVNLADQPGDARAQAAALAVAAIAVNLAALAWARSGRAETLPVGAADLA
jgi:ABC-type Fe3+ transport system permease subunit